VPSEADRLRPASEETRPSDDSAGASRFTALYEQHFDFVWRTVRLLGVPLEGVDDAVQDVFLVTHRRLDDFEARASVRTWLFAIAQRVASDHRRSRNRRQRLLEQARSSEREPSTTPFEQLAGAEARGLLASVLDRLNTQQREVFILADLEELSAPEIAVALQLNLNTVYSRLRAARREFARNLREVTGGTDPR
jgi:RNA polymerase sigma-70 factor (ECF subfamily)